VEDESGERMTDTALIIALAVIGIGWILVMRWALNQ
jgi:hypothetical protein